MKIAQPNEEAIAQGREAKLVKLEVYELDSIWKKQEGRRNSTPGVSRGIGPVGSCLRASAAEPGVEEVGGDDEGGAEVKGGMEMFVFVEDDSAEENAPDRFKVH